MWWIGRYAWGDGEDTRRREIKERRANAWYKVYWRGGRLQLISPWG